MFYLDVIHIWCPLWGVGGGVRQKWDVIRCRGSVGGGSKCSRRPIFIFFVTENWVCAESNINILLTRNLPIDSGVRQWSHPLMIPFHCLQAKSNYRMHGQFEWDVIWFCFYFEFVCSHAWCSCCSIVC